MHDLEQINDKLLHNSIDVTNSKRFPCMGPIPKTPRAVIMTVKEELLIWIRLAFENHCSFYEMTKEGVFFLGEASLLFIK